MKQPNVPIVRVEFNNCAPDFIYSVEQWDNGGRYKGFLKDNCISILDVKSVIHGTFMPFVDFHSLPAWEG